jgi:hypothetical protein
LRHLYIGEVVLNLDEFNDSGILTIEGIYSIEELVNIATNQVLRLCKELIPEFTDNELSVG